MTPERIPGANIAYKVADAAIRTAVALPGFEAKYKGLEHIPLYGQPYVAAFTHKASWWDAPLFASGIYQHNGTTIDLMAKRQLLENRLLGPMFRAMGAFPVSQARFDSSAVSEAVSKLDGGRVVGLAIEGGGLTDKNRMAKISSAAGLIMCLANVETLPVAIAGDIKRLAGGRINVVRKSLTRFGAAIPAPAGAGQFDLEKISTSGRMPLDLREMSRGFVKNELQPAFDELYAQTLAEYQQPLG